jgi:ribose transport system substrate-binding protein
VLDAVIARQPDAILIAPTDTIQLVEPLRRAHDAGIPVITVDTFIGNGVYQTGAGDADFPLSYIASDNVLGGRMAARALAEAIGEGGGQVYVSNVNPGISTTDQREEGFKLEMSENFSNIEVLETQFNENDANNAASQLQAVFARNPNLKGVFGANLFSAIGAANGVQQAGQTGNIRVVAFRRAAVHRGQHQVRPRGHGHRPAPATIGWFGVAAAYAHLTGTAIPVSIGTALPSSTAATWTIPRSPGSSTPSNPAHKGPPAMGGPFPFRDAHDLRPFPRPGRPVAPRPIHGAGQLTLSSASPAFRPGCSWRPS